MEHVLAAEVVGLALEHPSEASQLALGVVHEEHWVQLLTRQVVRQVPEVVRTCG